MAQNDAMTIYFAQNDAITRNGQYEVNFSFFCGINADKGSMCRE